MAGRRSFLKLSALSSATFITKNTWANELPFAKKNSIELNQPIVLSTWKFGIKANEAAWEILKMNGRALDAVEAGVKVPEADPEERSVGYGGRPDRDGRVTLDACIMDENANIGSVACLEFIKHFFVNAFVYISRKHFFNFRFATKEAKIFETFIQQGSYSHIVCAVTKSHNYNIAGYIFHHKLL